MNENDLKVAFIYNFTKFIEWPATLSTTNEFKIGVFADEALYSAMQKGLAGKNVRGKPIIVRRLTDPQEASTCALLFFGQNEVRRVTDLSLNANRLPILLVGETPKFIEAGGMISLFFEDKELRFRLNLPACEAARLTVSSKLARLARR